MSFKACSVGSGSTEEIGEGVVVSFFSPEPGNNNTKTKKAKPTMNTAKAIIDMVVGMTCPQFGHFRIFFSTSAPHFLHFFIFVSDT
jgi:hypothetical protein